MALSGWVSVDGSKTVELLLKLERSKVWMWSGRVWMRWMDGGESRRNAERASVRQRM